MPCPFNHAPRGDTFVPSPEPRTPLGRAVDWYKRDVNISRRVGWEHGPPPKPIMQIVDQVDKWVNELWPTEKTDGMDVPEKVTAILRTWQSAGVYPPADPKGEGGEERPYEAFWPPVSDVGIYAPVDPKGEGDPDRQRPYKAFWEEALTTLIDEQVGFGTVMPGRTPSGFQGMPGEQVLPWTGAGGFLRMADTFERARDLISPRLDAPITQGPMQRVGDPSSDIQPFRQADPTL